MQPALILSVVVLGFLGSWHCGVMCGPLSCNFRKKPDFFSYHVGRLISYLTVGSALFAGSQYLFASDSRWWRLLSAGLAAVLLIFFGLSQLGVFQNRLLNFKYYKFQFAILESCRSICNKFPVVLGLITGLFPCSWLYSFLILAARTDSLKMACTVIFVFWFTSLPAFFVFSGFMRHLIRNSPASYQKISGVVLILAGLLSIFGHWSEIILL